MDPYSQSAYVFSFCHSTGYFCLVLANSWQCGAFIHHYFLYFFSTFLFIAMMHLLITRSPINSKLVYILPYYLVTQMWSELSLNTSM